MLLTTEEIKLIVDHCDIGNGFQEESNPIAGEIWYVCQCRKVSGWESPPEHKPDCAASNNP